MNTGRNTMNKLANQSMSTGLVTVNCQDDLHEAYKTMREHRIRHLLVTDDSDDIVGIISDRDFQRAKWPLFKRKDAFVEPFFREGDSVESFMSWPIKSVPHNAELIEVVNIMIAEKISAVVVTQARQVVGIVTHEDLLKVLATFLGKSDDSVTKRLEVWAYNSPIGSLMTALANSGL